MNDIHHGVEVPQPFWAPIYEVSDCGESCSVNATYEFDSDCLRVEKICS